MQIKLANNCTKSIGPRYNNHQKDTNDERTVAYK